jgi:cation-transporting P-type ATPase 13A2
MFSIGLLALISIMTLLWPLQAVRDLMNLVTLPFGARAVLLMAVVANVVASMTFEEWGVGRIAGMIGALLRYRRGRRRARKAYKIVEGGMR